MEDDEEKSSEDSEYKTPSHQWSVDFLNDEFEKESDRAAVILVASLIDDCLTGLLKSYLVPIAQSQDSMFDSATAPMSTFSAKIDISHRIGLISAKLCRDLHLIRKIRNSFAHDIYGCSFDNGSVRARVDEVYNSICALEKEKESETRDKFLYLSSGILWHLNSLTQEIRSLHNPDEEWLYESTSETGE
jgi:hypothetical protein